MLWRLMQSSFIIKFKFDTNFGNCYTQTMIFEYGKNYSYLFLVFFVSAIILIIAGFILIALYLLLFTRVFFLISQLRSGVFLNRKCTAEFKKGSSNYNLLIFLNIIAIIFTTFVTYLYMSLLGYSSVFAL